MPPNGARSTPPCSISGAASVMAPNAEYGVAGVSPAARRSDHVFAHGDDAARPGDRVDLRGAQRQPIGGGQFGVQAAVTEPRGAQAHVTPHVQLHIVKADQVPAAPHIQQAGRHVQPVTDVEILHRRGNQLQEEVGAVQRLVTRLVEQDVGRGQAHLAGGSRGIDQRQRPRQPQALAHGQRDAAISAHVGIHRQVVKAPGLDAVHAQASIAVGQRRRGFTRPQVRGQHAVALVLRQHQLPLLVQRRFWRKIALIERAAERNAQGAAGRAIGSRRRAHRAVQNGLRAGRVQQRTRPQDEVPVDRTAGGVDIGLPVELAADLDRASSMHQPVALALGIHGDMAASGHVQHGLFTDPDRPGIGLGHASSRPSTVIWSAPLI
ncbi:hypothetical protein G6F31_013918 [Rhizopus arrhizus]|nr:hypothetical protein G6F31_013918 [Rhizopus arrhizus]